MVSVARLVRGKKVTDLEFTTEHPASHYGLGVLLLPSGEVLDGAAFRLLRDVQEARIETDDPAGVCGALGVPEGEAGVIGAIIV
jgi:hypothetical protein